MGWIAVEITHLARDSADINQRSGVSVRTSITVYETMLANAFRRALQLDEKVVVPRISDLQYILAALYGKLEFEVFDESEEDAVVTKLINTAVKNIWDRVYDLDEMEAMMEYFENTESVEVGADVPLDVYASCVASSEALRDTLKNYAPESASLASELEFLLEGMYLHDLVSRGVICTS